MPELTPFDRKMLKTFRIADEPIPDARPANPDHECAEQTVRLTLEDYRRLTAMAGQGDLEHERAIIWRNLAVVLGLAAVMMGVALAW